MTSTGLPCGRSPVTASHVLPRSVVRRSMGRSSPDRYALVATYATFAAKLDCSIRTIHWLRAPSGKLLVNSVHLPPSFSVTQSRLSSVPPHNRPAHFGDSASEQPTA